MTPKKVLIIILVILGLAAYGVGSYWIIGIIQGEKTVPFIPRENTAATTTVLPQPTVPGTTIQTTPQPTLKPTPTPTPLQGPGDQACDPEGICKNYSNEARKPCPRTFADWHCLGMCGTPAVRCPPQ